MNVYLNDKIVPSEEAMISASDAGFLYGSGLFETLRVENGIVFGVDQHLNRLFNSAAALEILLTHTQDSLKDAITEVLKVNDLLQARVRLTVSAGIPSGDGQPPQSTVLITAAPLVPYAEACYSQGILAILCPYRQNPADPLAGHKGTSFFSRMLGLRTAHKKQAAEALWFTTDGYLAEGCVSNIFLVQDGTLLTPPLGTPVLPGVARHTVCELAASHNLDLEEKALRIDDLLGADEVLVTNVIMKVMPVVNIEQHTVGKGTVGPVTQTLMTLFDDVVATQCGSQT
ncbi:MAG: aminotransferase class IV [Phycisphaeraceae bacterium]|nr:aminotransferase class IV [Phycisphaeraceae bacterium]